MPKIVNYADDLVICCHRGAREALEGMRGIMARLKLTVNEDKTRLCRVPEQCFDFLGYTFGRCYSTKTGRAYLGTTPSKKSIKRLIESIGELTERKHFHHEAAELVRALNRKLTGWANYFCLGPVSKAYCAIDAYTSQRLRQWLCGKHQAARPGIPTLPGAVPLRAVVARAPVDAQRRTCRGRRPEVLSESRMRRATAGIDWR